MSAYGLEPSTNLPQVHAVLGNECRTWLSARMDPLPVRTRKHAWPSHSIRKPAVEQQVASAQPAAMRHDGFIESHSTPWTQRHSNQLLHCGHYLFNSTGACAASYSVY